MYMVPVGSNYFWGSAYHDGSVTTLTPPPRLDFLLPGWGRSVKAGGRRLGFRGTASGAQKTIFRVPNSLTIAGCWESERERESRPRQRGWKDPILRHEEIIPPAAAGIILFPSALPWRGFSCRPRCMSVPCLREGCPAHVRGCWGGPPYDELLRYRFHYQSRNPRTPIQRIGQTKGPHLCIAYCCLVHVERRKLLFNIMYIELVFSYAYPCVCLAESRHLSTTVIKWCTRS